MTVLEQLNSGSLYLSVYRRGVRGFYGAGMAGREGPWHGHRAHEAGHHGQRYLFRFAQRWHFAGRAGAERQPGGAVALAAAVCDRRAAL